LTFRNLKVRRERTNSSDIRKALKDHLKTYLPEAFFLSAQEDIIAGSVGKIA